MQLRQWQEEALQKFEDSDKRNYLVVACPGAGKTTFALTAAKRMKDRREIDQVVVVVPSDALRTQWASSTLIDLRPYNSGTKVHHPDFDGIVTTYQALAMGTTADLIAYSINTGRRTLVIFDEIHHAGADSAFGQSVSRAFENAERRLLLSGTPWKENGEQIPYTSFDATGMLDVDYTYSFGQAVEDGVCRGISFPAVYGEASWMRDGEEFTRRVEPNLLLNGKDASDTIRSLLDASPSGGWMREVLRQANETLESWRRQFPDAAGLVVARDKLHAQQVASLLKEVTGHSAPVVVSGEDGGDTNDAQSVINKFRTGTQPWIVAVKMIAEGVDIPRLMVGVYATNVTTNMFFTQVVGRFVRKRQNEDARARLYIVPTAKMWGLATAIEDQQPPELMQELEERDGKELRRRTGGGGILPTEVDSPFISLGSTSDGLGAVASSGEGITGGVVQDWQDFFANCGIPIGFADQAAKNGEAPPPTNVETAVPKYQQKKKLQQEINKLAGQVAHHQLGNHKMKPEVNKKVWYLYRKPVKELTIAQMKHVIEVLKNWLKTGELVA